jgi:hypothetical protein
MQREKVDKIINPNKKNVFKNQNASLPILPQAICYHM